MEDTDLARWLEEEYGKTEKSSEPALEKVVEVADSLEIEEVDEDLLLANINDRIDKQKPKRKLFAINRVAAIAAAVAGFIFAFNFFGKANYTAVDSVALQTIEHTLPDNSMVTLNSNSEVTYDDAFEKRTLTLEGEAFFNVEKGSTFTVKTDNGQIQVLGTSFNVFSRSEHFVVACLTGKVKVDSKEESIILNPGEQASLRNGNLEKDKISVENVNAWIEGESKFDQRPIGEVIESLINYYGLEFKNSDSIDLNRKYTGSYSHNDLDKALKMIFLPMGIEYSLEKETTLKLQ